MSDSMFTRNCNYITFIFSSSAFILRSHLLQYGSAYGNPGNTHNNYC